MPIQKYDKSVEKAVLFFSASNAQDAEFLHDVGVNEILTSFFYIKKRPEFFTELLTSLKERGGLFMMDSGAFSFLGYGRKVQPEHSKPDFWIPYIEEYLEWVDQHINLVDVIVNMDLDFIVGRDIVDKWNDKYFKPYLKKTQTVFVAHRDHQKKYNDANGFKRVQEYVKEFDYIGINGEMIDLSVKAVQLARSKNVRFHGFGWTSIPRLISEPLFSVDSTTWLGGVRYGTSYVSDGQNFRTNDYKKKFYRRADKNLCEEHGIDFDKLMIDEKWSVNHYNLVGWQMARDKYVRHARTKLINKPVSFYMK